MKIEGDGKRVSVFLGESDRAEGMPTYEAIVRLLRERGCAGATVLRGVMGFGAGSVIHRATFLDLSEDLPVLVVFADTAERVDAVLPEIDKLLSGGIVLVEDVHIATYRGTPRE